LTVVQLYSGKTMLKYAKNDANWFRHFKDVGDQTQRLRYLDPQNSFVTQLHYEE